MVLESQPHANTVVYLEVSKRLICVGSYRGCERSCYAFSLTRKALRTHKTIKNLSVQRRRYSSILEPFNWIAWIPSQVSRRFFFPLHNI